MGKFYGCVGFSESIEDKPGIWKNRITERNYSGDIIKNKSRFSMNEFFNPSIVNNNTISIVYDDYAYKHMDSIRYVKYRDVRWCVVSVEERKPRLELYLGGVYNE